MLSMKNLGNEAMPIYYWYLVVPKYRSFKFLNKLKQFKTL